MGSSDISKDLLYESVKTLLERSSPHVHLYQHKLYTLFSISFNYFLYMSTKSPGSYLLRIEDSFLAHKLARKAKDETTRKFLNRLLIPRKMVYGKSTFYLDYFQLSTWGLLKEIPQGQLKGALIVAGTSSQPVKELPSPYDEEEHLGLPKDYFYYSLQELFPKTIIISYEKNFEEAEKVDFPFIVKEEEILDGVKINKNLNWETE